MEALKVRSRVLTHYQKCQDNAPGGDDLHNIRSLFSSEIYIKKQNQAVWYELTVVIELNSGLKVMTLYGRSGSLGTCVSIPSF